jgi:hypothetical protein
MKALLAVALIAGVMSTGCFWNITTYTHDDGSTVYVGNYYNDAPGPGFAQAEVAGRLYDADGNLLDTAGGVLCRGVDPKGVIPFKAWTGAAIPKPARIDWSIAGPSAEPLLATGLEATVTNTFVSAGLTYVVGELTNASKNVYVAGTVCVSFSDSDGNIVRESWNNGGAWRFNPGDTLPFSVPIDTPPAGSVIHLYLDGGVGFPGVAVDIPMSALKHNFQETVSDAGAYVTHGMGEVENKGSLPFLPDAVATVRDAAGTLLATRGDPSDCMVNAAPGSFTYMTYQVIANVPTKPRVNLQGFQYTAQTVYFPEVSDVKMRADRDAHTITVTGTLTNASSVVLTTANVCAGAYDRRGTVRSVQMISADLPPAGLVPGASVAFSITMPDPGNVLNVKAIADAFN